jgi:hypothetical protein
MYNKAHAANGQTRRVRVKSAGAGAQRAHRGASATKTAKIWQPGAMTRSRYATSSDWRLAVMCVLVVEGLVVLMG